LVCGLFLVLATGDDALAQQPRARLEAELTPTRAAGLGSAKAKFESRGNRRKFSVEGEDLTPFNGRSAVVTVAGRRIGAAPISGGLFDLNRDTRNGQAVPNMAAGDVVVVTVDGTRLFRGALAAN
jgi:hypothetical protein